MDKLLAFLNAMSPDDRARFARSCGTSINYLRKAISTKQKIGEGLCILIERESRRAVCCEDIRADVDWAYLRGTAPCRLAANDSKAVQEVAHG